ncbi:unnamed protein product [Parascedosporium putredinis]|uniref:NAD(P)-binding protein n=1 Tax=Parascedosporium putredinis TaxID=1442378 RepID=A0A9P1H5L6_9PEZI|nr:unnamed protein product [Parascedosporium putredinis]CAI7999449.1 unnamed protein product [Parascedosporium putredinis]
MNNARRDLIPLTTSSFKRPNPPYTIHALPSPTHVVTQSSDSGLVIQPAKPSRQDGIRPPCCCLPGRQASFLKHLTARSPLRDYRGSGALGTSIATEMARAGARVTLLGRSEEKLRLALQRVLAAGIPQSNLLFKTEYEAIDRLLETNLSLTIKACKAATRPLMRAAPDACIINMSSVLGTHANVPIKPEQIPLGRYGDPSEVAHAAMFLATNRYANNCILNIDGGLSVGLL